MIDASIPLQARGLADFIGQNQQNRMRSIQMEQQQQQMQADAARKTALRDLMAGGNFNGQIPTQGPAWDAYAQADPEGAFDLFNKMSAQQREQTAKGLEDIAAAVQYADTPQKWAVVQQHYGRYDPQLAQVPFEMREQALIHLGKMGDYLNATQPKDKTSGIAQELLDAGYQPGTPEFENAMRGVINNKYASEYVDENGNTRRRSALNLGGAPMTSAPVVTKMIGGKTYYQQNGKWYEGDAGSNASGGFPAR